MANNQTSHWTLDEDNTLLNALEKAFDREWIIKGHGSRPNAFSRIRNFMNSARDERDIMIRFKSFQKLYFHMEYALNNPAFTWNKELHVLEASEETWQIGNWHT